MSQDDQEQDKDKLSIKQITRSVMAAGIGVQSDKNREEDFKKGNIKTYIVAGIIFTVLFVVGVVSIVRLVLSQAG